MSLPQINPPAGSNPVPFSFEDLNKLPYKTIDDIDPDIRSLIVPADLEFFLELDKKCRSRPFKDHHVMNLTGERHEYISRYSTGYVLQKDEIDRMLGSLNTTPAIFMFPHYGMGLEYSFFAGNVEEAKDYFKFCEGFNSKNPEHRLFAENLIVIHERQLPKEYDLKKMKEFYLAPKNVEAVSLFFPYHTPTDNNSRYEY